jgi:hypothetical protein
VDERPVTAVSIALTAPLAGVPVVLPSVSEVIAHSQSPNDPAPAFDAPPQVKVPTVSFHGRAPKPRSDRKKKA